MPAETVVTRLEEYVAGSDRAKKRSPKHLPYAVIPDDDARKLLALVEALRDGLHVLKAMPEMLNSSEGARIETILAAYRAVGEP